MNKCWYSKNDQTFVNYNKMDLPLENRIYKNNMIASTHWVPVYKEINRKENVFSYFSQFSQSGWFVVNKPINHHKCHNCTVLNPKTG